MKHGATKKEGELARSALRDHASGGKIESIWRRIEDELPLAKRPRLSRSGLRPVLWATLTFIGGIVLGVEVSDGTQSLFRRAPVPLLQAEPNARVTQAPGAGPVISNELAPTEPEREILQASPAALESSRGLHRKGSFFDLTHSPTQGSNAVAAPEWQRLAENGNYEEALHSIEALGGFDAELRVASAERLMLLGDVARATGNRQLAAQALKRVTEQHASDPLAPLAAWTLGNMLEKAGDRPGAAEAFATYRALSPQGDFAEDALARQARVAVEEADLTLATRLAAQYEKSFPHGRRATEIREQLARLRAHATWVLGDPSDAGVEPASTTNTAAPSDPPLFDPATSGDSVNAPSDPSTDVVDDNP